MALPKNPIRSAPAFGSILKCCFDGFIVPEMVKARPVLIVSKPISARSKLCTIIPLSTTEPNPKMPYHLKISMPAPHLPAPYDEVFAWVKADMIYAVSFKRLEKFYDKSNNKKYIVPVLDTDTMKEVQRRILRGLSLRHLEGAL